MADTTHDLHKRFLELARRSLRRGSYVYTDFLTISEQEILRRTAFERDCAPFILYGGYEAAERQVACFGSEEICGYPESPPVVCLAIRPVSAKFAEALTHRDFLGALMGLGLSRDVLGDIVVDKNTAYLFCREDLAGFICDQFNQVRHTAVSCAAVDALPDDILPKSEPRELIVASERADALIAAVYKFSREDSRNLIATGKVFIDDQPLIAADRLLREGERVSVRGYGRFVYGGVLRQTAKGRLRVGVTVS